MKVLITFFVLLVFAEGVNQFPRKVHNYVYSVIGKMTKDPQFKAIADAAWNSPNPLTFMDTKKHEIMVIQTRILKQQGLNPRQISIIKKLSDGESHSKFDVWFPRFKALPLEEKKILHNVPNIMNS